MNENNNQNMMNNVNQNNNQNMVNNVNQNNQPVENNVNLFNQPGGYFTSLPPQQTGVNYDIPPQVSEKVEKVYEVVDKLSLVVKRIVLGIVIFFLFFSVLFDTGLVIQTVTSRNYINVTAEYVETKETEEDEVFNDVLYSFTDTKGRTQIITEFVSKDETPANEISIKYNEDDPQKYYGEGATLKISGSIFYLVKIIILVVLIVLFFNKNLLSKIHISVSSR